MPLSNSGVRVINPILSTVVQGYRNSDLVGNALFPRVPVAASGGQILEFGKEAFMQYAAARAPGGTTKRIPFGYLGKPYTLFNEALESQVPREHLRDAKQVPGLDLAVGAVNTVMKSLLLSLEVAQANLALNAANYASSNKVALAGASKWSDYANSDPAAQMEGYRDQIRQACGVFPNTLLLSAQAMKTLKQHPKILDRLKYTGRDVVTEDLIANLWNIKNVVVGGSIKADDAGVLSDVWGNNAVLAYVPQSKADLQAIEPSYGYTYTMEGHPLVEEPYWEANSKSWIYGVSFERAPVLSGISAGFLIQNPA